MPVKTRKMTIAVIAARTVMRRRAASKAASVESPNAARLAASAALACTVWAARSVSDARAELSATLSWLSRLSRRTRRPRMRIGSTTIGTISSVYPASFGAVQIISAMPPTKSSTLRSATETEEEITDRINVVSVVRREITSPVSTVSKKPGLIAMTRS